ncbi:MAG: Flp pilus assembly protein CpaB [Alphaproteobacteria bacterium]|nr:Flp pilus assembly protein CpaB [Alphaproteobacteria bacterium]MDE2073218.1 Flp pilus assembly protein CpaB [Alphaproteobacteria bacterium]
MNRSRVIILGLAGFAAIVAALMVRALLGGGTEKGHAAPTPPPVAMSDVLVAASNIQAGSKLTPAMVRWQSWPKSAVDSSFIAESGTGNVASIVDGTVARAPLVAGEPLSTTKIVHANSAGFMAAQLSPGMRAVSIRISVESGAGGFILPNDRVDVLLTRKASSGQHFSTHTILEDVRVLAIDQTFGQNSREKTVVGKTATLELTPQQAMTIAQADAAGTLSLSLRALGDNSGAREMATAGGSAAGVSVIRYGLSPAGTGQSGE